MADLDPSQARLLVRLARSQRPMALAGAILALLGAVYLVWGVRRFDPYADPRENPGFDWPIARLAFVFEDGRFVTDNALPKTPGEDRLLRGLSRNMNFSAGVMVFLLRTFLGTLALVSGFAIMTVVVERARLIAIIRQLRE